MIYILFVLGFIFLIKGADFMVDGASSIAKKFKVSSLVIGLTIIAIGTSAPELLVNIMSAVHGQTDLALGNILGSNSANILLILGITAIFSVIVVKSSTVYKEIPFCILSSVILLFMASDGFLNGETINYITRSEGLILLGFFVIFGIYTFSIAKSDKQEIKEIDEIKTMSHTKSILLIIGGIAGLGLGSKWIVDGTSEIGKLLGISETVIGLTVVAIGTSLPELITSIVAIRKKEVDLAVGNIVGSNIFNTFMILGITAIITPIPVGKAHFDIWVNVIASILLFIFVFTGKRTFFGEKKHILSRKEGIILFSLYVIYMIYIVWTTLK